MNVGAFFAQLIYQTASAELQEWVYPTTIIIATALVLFAVVKDYIDKYVQTSKI